MSKYKRYSVRTRDGWKLALYRYQAQQARGGPVLLVHGLGVNRFNLDAPDEEISLARYLHRQGHDVWVAELRGAGRSRPVGWPLKRYRPYDFDDYVHRDVPALLRHVLDSTGYPALHWVGHSLGGMLAYAALEHYDQDLFASVVTVGSPAFTAMKHPAVDLIYPLRHLLNIVSWVPQRATGYLGALFPKITINTVGAVLANPKNLSPAHMRALAHRALANPSSRLIQQVAGWYGGESGFSRTDGLLDYYSKLGRIRAPMLMVAGAEDKLTPLADLRFVYDAISSEDKEFLVCGREQGFSSDYGHIDLILGTRAQEEVYPHMLRWIEDHGIER